MQSEVWFFSVVPLMYVSRLCILHYTENTDEPELLVNIYMA